MSLVFTLSVCPGILLPSSASLLSSLCSYLSSSSVSLVLGLSLTLLGFVTFIVSPQLETALTHLVQTWTALAGGKGTMLIRYVSLCCFT